MFELLKKVGIVLGVVGGALTLLAYIMDSKIDRLETRMVDRFALLREINEIKEDVTRCDDRIDSFHVVTGPIGRAPASIPLEALGATIKE